MANYISTYSGSQVDNVIGLFHNKGLDSVTGIVKRKSDGTFEAASAGAGTVTSVNSGDGLTGGPVTSSGTIKANLLSFTKLTRDAAAATETADRIYPVVLDKSGYLAVNVPWINTTYTKSTGSQSVAAGSAASFTQGTDSFTAASLESGFYSEGSAASFTQGTFSQGTLPSLDTSKFSGGSFTSGTFTQGTLPTLSMNESNKTLTISFGQGTLPTHGSDSFTGASIASGFFSQGTLPTHGSDSFSANTPTTIDTSKFSGGSFTQGTDSFTANTPTAVTLQTTVVTDIS